MIVLDIETTGLDPQKNAIVSIGAVDFLKKRRDFYLECRIFDGAEISAKALDVNGFSRESITSPDKPSLEDAMRQFFLWSTGCVEKTIAGMNPRFDSEFLRAAYSRCGKEWNLGHRTVDLHAICYANYLYRGISPVDNMGRSALTTNVILNYVGLPSEPEPHNGLTGARMEAEAFSRLVHRRPFLAEYWMFPVPEYIV